MSALACCPWCKRVIDSRYAVRLAREGYPAYCDLACENADLNALDLRVVHEMGDVLYG